ncbi:MAG TPA: hypothetical protein VH497_11505 [Vicinamibacterales bacterium]|jgi:hypothetical protein
MSTGTRKLQPGDIEARITNALSREDGLDPRSVQFLLRLYATTGRDDLADAAGLALAAALRDYATAPSPVDRSAWLETFVDARALADDPRVGEAIACLAAELRGAWTDGSVVVAASALDACVRAAMLDEHRSLAQPAVDQLERIVKASYRPGSGVGHCADQITLAGALLSAYQLSGRLPYSMLAEELVAAARPFMENECDLTTACHAVRALCRLAALHSDDHYRRAAVVAPSSDYRREAVTLLERRSDEAALGDAAAAAIYGVALLELESST